MSAPMDHETAVQKLAPKIKDIGFAMLTTTCADGTLHSRPMATQQVEFDGTLWFFTGASTHKTDEIAQDSHVNVSYSNPDDNLYVSVSGRASVVRDPAKAKELWNPAYRAWFPGGLDDPELVLLRVDVEEAEYWDSPSSPVAHILGFAKALVTGKKMDNPGDNEKLDLK